MYWTVRAWYFCAWYFISSFHSIAVEAHQWKRTSKLRAPFNLQTRLGTERKNCSVSFSVPCLALCKKNHEILLLMICVPGHLLPLLFLLCHSTKNQSWRGLCNDEGHWNFAVQYTHWEFSTPEEDRKGTTTGELDFSYTCWLWFLELRSPNTGWS